MKFPADSYITYKHAITSGLAVITLLVSILWGVMELHAGAPHKDAARRDDVKQVLETIKRLHREMREDVKELRQVILNDLRRSRGRTATDREGFPGSR